MAYAKPIKGEDSIFYIKYNDIWCPISCETSSPISESVEMMNTTTRDNGGWKTEKPTLQSYSIAVDALLKLDDESDVPEALSYNKLRLMKRNRELVEWKRETLGGWYIDQGQAYITEISDSNAVDEEITFSMSLSGFGAPEITTNPNLVPKSDFQENGFTGWTVNGGVLEHHPAEGVYFNLSGLNDGFYQYFPWIKAGTIYTISIWTRATSFAELPFINLGFNSGEVQYVALPTTDQAYIKTSVTVKANVDGDSIIIYNGKSSINRFYLKYMKVEEGTVATPWIPNIND